MYRSINRCAAVSSCEAPVLHKQNQLSVVVPLENRMLYSSGVASAELSIHQPMNCIVLPFRRAAIVR